MSKRFNVHKKQRTKGRELAGQTEIHKKQHRPTTLLRQRGNTRAHEETQLSGRVLEVETRLYRQGDSRGARCASSAAEWRSQPHPLPLTHKKNRKGRGRRKAKAKTLYNKINLNRNITGTILTSSGTKSFASNRFRNKHFWLEPKLKTLKYCFCSERTDWEKFLVQSPDFHLCM